MEFTDFLGWAYHVQNGLVVQPPKHQTCDIVDHCVTYIYVNISIYEIYMYISKKSERERVNCDNRPKKDGKT